MAKTGVVDLMIWWKGTETIALMMALARNAEWKLAETYNETLEMAMLIVKRKEKATRASVSWAPNLVGFTYPRASSAKQPSEADAA